MNAKSPRSGIILMTAATVSFFTTGVASAASSYLEQYGYEEEMNRCIDLLRPVMRISASQTAGAAKIIYDVQDVDLRGPWYRFEISVSVEDEAGAKLLDGYKVGCRSNRWIESAQLKDRRNSEELPGEMALFASK